MGKVADPPLRGMKLVMRQVSETPSFYLNSDFNRGKKCREVEPLGHSLKPAELDKIMPINLNKC